LSAITSTPVRPPGILVVDDDRQVLHLLQIYLRSRGFKVWIASHAQEALETQARHAAELDLVLLDVQLPEVDGPGIMVALQQADAKLRFCFMTGESGRYHPRDLLKMGALEVFAKPFELPALGAELDKILKSPDTPEK
jgi:two-component system response regulator AtoC